MQTATITELINRASRLVPMGKHDAELWASLVMLEAEGLNNGKSLGSLKTRNAWFGRLCAAHKRVQS